MPRSVARSSLVRSLLLPWFLIAALSSLWALATPIGGSPDEPAHVVKAASVVRGQLLPTEMIAAGGVLEVPAAFDHEYSQGCFAFFADVPASCAPPLQGDPAALVESHSSASLYNPVYYALVGWPSLIAPDVVGIYAMRIVSAVLCSFFVASAFWLIASWQTRRLPSLGVLIGLTPIVVYLMGTVNPNALEFSGGLALFVAMVSITSDPGAKRFGPALAIAVVAAALVSNARGISPLWVALLLVLPLLLLTGRQVVALFRRPSVLVGAGVIVASALYSAWWTLSSNSLGTGPSTGPEVVPDVPGVGLSPLPAFIGEFGNFYLRMRQMVGVLGWLDTPLNPLAYYLCYLLFGLLVLGVVVFVRGRALVFVGATAVVFLVAPPAVQSVYVARGGFIWQGRYSLILLLALLVCMAFGIARSERFQAWIGSHRRLAAIAPWVVALIWAFVTIWAFLTTLRRMTVGYSTGWAQMLGPDAWAPPSGVVLTTILFALFALALAALTATTPRDHECAKATAPAR
ncbi:DUF2142 domain-containing protein [Herbiconiux liangxiaofengii]|uniref:DUF2142 domain-containing protein n=1 Tax=Herbiconiux liangxiaofengii TaxID=3342795 RepID=UPI0035BB1451